MKLLVLGTCLFVAYSAAYTNDDEVVPRAKNEDFSYTVMLSMLNKRHIIVKYCAGTRLSEEWFITAAECLDQTTAEKFVLTYSARTKNYLPIPFDLSSVQYFIHPQYDQNTKANNLALIRCEPCGQQVKGQIPKLPTPDDVNNSFSGEPAVVTGINSTEATNFQQFELLSLKTKIVSSLWCKLTYWSSVGKDHICASNWGHTGLSEADVGAPLVVNDESDGSVTVIGVATSVEFWSTVFPILMVFTKVAPHTDWIQNITKNFSLNNCLRAQY